MFVRHTLTAVCFALALSAAAAGQSKLPEAVKETVNAGASLYRAGRYAEAQEHFERALREAPDSVLVALFVARAAHRQFRPGLDTPANRAKGAEAVAAYERLLRLDRGGATWQSEEAFKSILYLHGHLGDEARVRELLSSRALDESAAPERRAEAFVILASKQWQCAHDINVRKENKRADLARARACVARGLGLIEQAEGLAPKDPNVFAHKASLLREAGKLAEMEGDWRRRAEYERLSAEALETHRRLTAEGPQKKEAEGPRPADELDPPDPQR